MHKFITVPEIKKQLNTLSKEVLEENAKQYLIFANSTKDIKARKTLLETINMINKKLEKDLIEIPVEEVKVKVLTELNLNHLKNNSNPILVEPKKTGRPKKEVKVEQDIYNKAVADAKKRAEEANKIGLEPVTILEKKEVAIDNGGE